MNTGNRMTYYDLIKRLNSDQLDLGMKRLGRVLTKSCEIQSLTGREIHKLTEAFYTVGLNPTHIGDIKKGVRTLREDTLARLVFILMEVDYFEFVGSDKIGIPHFKYKGANYNSQKHNRLKLMGLWQSNGTNEADRPKVSDLPDLDYRYKNVKSLVDIILGGNNIKSVYTLQSTEKRQPTLSVA